MHKTHEIPTLLNVKQLARVVPYSENTIRKLCAPKSKSQFPIPCKRIARRLYFDRKDVVDFIERA